MKATSKGIKNRHSPRFLRSGRALGILAAVSVIGLLLSNVSCTQPVHEVTTELVDFDSVFVLQDTVRLDPSVIMGRIDDMDISDSGTMLVRDGSAQAMYRFSAAGQFLYELSVEECHPGADFRPWSARFIGGGHIIAWGEGLPTCLTTLAAVSIT